MERVNRYLPVGLSSVNNGRRCGWVIFRHSSKSLTLPILLRSIMSANKIFLPVTSPVILILCNCSSVRQRLDDISQMRSSSVSSSSHSNGRFFFKIDSLKASNGQHSPKSFERSKNISNNNYKIIVNYSPLTSPCLFAWLIDLSTVWQNNMVFRINS